MLAAGEDRLRALVEQPDDLRVPLGNRLAQLWAEKPIGLARSLAPPALAGPDQVANFAFERPVFDTPIQMLADGSLLNLGPFRGAVPSVAHSMMPAARLKLPLR